MNSGQPYRCQAGDKPVNAVIGGDRARASSSKVGVQLLIERDHRVQGSLVMRDSHSQSATSRWLRVPWML